MATETKQDVTVKKSAQIQPAAQPTAITPFDEMQRLFDRLLPRGWMPSLAWDAPLLSKLGETFDLRMPRADMIDGDETIVIRAAVPGVDRKDLEVSVNDTSVSIKGKTMHEMKEEKGDYMRREIGSGEFTRTFTLPCMVDGSKATASLKDGMLELTLPKMEKAKRHAVKIG